MTAETTVLEKPTTATNGVAVDDVLALIGRIQDDPGHGKARFRARNAWVTGGLNRSKIQGFYAAGAEDSSRTAPFVVDNDEPLVLASEDAAPNPVEYVLHALAGCVTTTMVYHAAVRGIEIEAVDSELEGDIDLRGIFGLADDVRKGYSAVRVKLRVKTTAPAEELEGLAKFSPVFDIVSNSLPVTLTVETY